MKFCCCILVILPLTVLAQTPPSASAKFKSFMGNKFIQRISIRQSFQGKAEKEEAAYVNFVRPKDKPNSYNLSVAVGYTFLPAFWNITPFFERQRNTLSDKEQDITLAGVEFQLTLTPKKLSSPTSFLIPKLNYKKDEVKTTESLQGSLYYTISLNGKGNTFYPLPDVDNEMGWLGFYYNPYVGVEYENRYWAKADTLQGATFRFALRVTANVYPLSNLLDRRLEIVPDYTFRVSPSNSTEAEKDKNEIFKIDFNVVLIKSKIVGKDVLVKFGVNYTKGVDPSKGFENQELITHAFKVKL